MKKIFLGLITLYQKTLSPFVGWQCRFYPTCSCYMRQAIETHGTVKGIMLGLWRLLRCQPFCKGGIDEVPDQFQPIGAIKQRLGKIRKYLLQKWSG